MNGTKNQDLTDLQFLDLELLILLRGVMRAKSPAINPDMMLLIAARDFVLPPDDDEEVNQELRKIEAEWDHTEQWNERMSLLPDPRDMKGIYDVDTRKES